MIALRAKAVVIGRIVWSIVTACSIATIALGQASDENRSWQRIDRAADATALSRADSLVRERFLWRLFDSAVVSALDRSLSIDSINRTLARRHQYRGPTPGQMTLQTADATFWRQLPRDAPSFYVAALGADVPDVLLGVFQIEREWGNGPSHLSIYRRIGDRWQRATGISSDREIFAYRIPGDSGSAALATIEHWQRADGDESELKFWRFENGGLRRIARADTTRFQDLNIGYKDSALVLWSAQFPRHVEACTMCTRLIYEHVLTAAEGRVREQIHSLSPWASLVDDFYGYLADRRVGAAQRLLSPSIRATALAGGEPEFQADTGDFEAGRGTAVVSVAGGDCGRTFQFRSQRLPDGQWRIVDVELGRWDWDRRVFIRTLDSARQKPKEHPCNS